jgi:hypothetical protein
LISVASEIEFPTGTPGRRLDVLSDAAKQLSHGGSRVESIAADVSTDKCWETKLKFALDAPDGSLSTMQV